MDKHLVINRVIGITYRSDLERAIHHILLALQTIDDIEEYISDHEHRYGYDDNADLREILESDQQNLNEMVVDLVFRLYVERDR